MHAQSILLVIYIHTRVKNLLKYENIRFFLIFDLVLTLRLHSVDDPSAFRQALDDRKRQNAVQGMGSAIL